MCGHELLEHVGGEVCVALEEVEWRDAGVPDADPGDTFEDACCCLRFRPASG